MDLSRLVTPQGGPMIEPLFDARYTSVVIVQHLREGHVAYELDKRDELREPPVPVAVRLRDEWHDAELHGWAQDPNGSDDGWRGR